MLSNKSEIQILFDTHEKRIWNNDLYLLKKESSICTVETSYLRVYHVNYSFMYYYQIMSNIRFPFWFE